MLWIHYIICDIDANVWGVEKRKSRIIEVISLKEIVKTIRCFM